MTGGCPAKASSASGRTCSPSTPGPSVTCSSPAATTRSSRDTSTSRRSARRFSPRRRGREPCRAGPRLHEPRGRSAPRALSRRPSRRGPARSAPSRSEPPAPPQSAGATATEHASAHARAARRAAHGEARGPVHDRLHLRAHRRRRHPGARHARRASNRLRLRKLGATPRPPAQAGPFAIYYRSLTGPDVPTMDEIMEGAQGIAALLAPPPRVVAGARRPPPPGRSLISMRPIRLALAPLRAPPRHMVGARDHLLMVFAGSAGAFFFIVSVTGPAPCVAAALVATALHARVRPARNAPWPRRAPRRPRARRARDRALALRGDRVERRAPLDCARCRAGPHAAAVARELHHEHPCLFESSQGPSRAPARAPLDRVSRGVGARGVADPVRRRAPRDCPAVRACARAEP